MESPENMSMEAFLEKIQVIFEPLVGKGHGSNLITLLHRAFGSDEGESLDLDTALAVLNAQNNATSEVAFILRESLHMLSQSQSPVVTSDQFLAEAKKFLVQDGDAVSLADGALSALYDKWIEMAKESNKKGLALVQKLSAAEALGLIRMLGYQPDLAQEEREGLGHLADFLGEVGKVSSWKKPKRS